MSKTSGPATAPSGGLEHPTGEPESRTPSSHAIARYRADMESALLKLPLVADCAVLVKSTPAGKVSVAYLVLRGKLARSKIEGHLREAFPAARLPDRYAFISRMPLTASGALDEDGLSKIPVVDEILARDVEALLASRSGVVDAAVFVEERPRSFTLLHEQRLLPRRALLPSPAPLTSSASNDDGSGEDGAAPPIAHAKDLAMAEGAPLPDRAGAPRTLPDALRSAAMGRSEPCITYLGYGQSVRRETFGELLSEARRIHGGLRGAGLETGEMVLFQLERPEDILPAFWGCLLGGYVPVIAAVPATYDAETNELTRLRDIIGLLKKPVVLTQASTLTELGPLLSRVGARPGRAFDVDTMRRAAAIADEPDVDPDAPAFLTLTSGSTGTPKAIMLSHKNILARAEGTNLLCEHGENDRILNWLPFDHIGSISDWHLRCVLIGCHMVYCTKDYVLGDPLNWLRLIDRFRITHSWAPNFAYALVNEAVKNANERWDLSCLEGLLTAGEAVSSNTVREFLDCLSPFGLARTALRPAFGMAELGSGVTYFLPTREQPVRVRYVDRERLDGVLRNVDSSDPRAARFTSLGRIIPSAKMRIVDERDRPLAEDTVGRLQIAGDPVCLGYYENAEANREVFAANGWFNTGDRGFLSDGELYLTGRDKETLVINGANYHNGEIESAVEAVPGVRVSFTAACAVRDANHSERLAVFFCADVRDDAELRTRIVEVQNGVSRKTGVKPDYLLPVEAGSIPKTAIGKIQRKELVKRFERGEFEALVQRVDLLLGSERTIPDWFLRPAFRPKALPSRSPAASRPRRFLVVDDGHGLANRVAAEFERRGVPSLTVRQTADVPRFAPSFTDVVDMADYGPDDFPGKSPEGDTDVVGRAVRRMVELAHSRSTATDEPANEPDAKPCYRVIASRSQATAPADTVDPSRAMVPAVLSALAQEVGTADYRHVDVPFVVDERACAEVAQLVVTECLADARDEEVVYRNELRLVRCFRRVAWPDPGARSVRFEFGALYLVTGGLGGVGVELARYLVDQWGAALVIVGRTPLEGLAEADGTRRTALADLARRGAVYYEAADATDVAALSAVVARAEEATGKRVTGAFHLASAYRELPLARETPESLEAALAAKVRGAEAMHAVLDRDAFLVCFSSLAGVYGGAGIGAYAAANRLLDAVCQDQRARGRASYNLNWSLWKGLGIGGNGAPVEALASKGYLPIQAARGFSSLVAALGLAPGQLMVGVDPDHPNVAWQVDAPALPLGSLIGAVVVQTQAEDVAIDPSTARDVFDNEVPVAVRRMPHASLAEDGKLDRAALLAALRGATNEARVAPSTPLQERLARIWKDVLGLDEVGVNESFFDLGGTSLLSVRLFAEIERAFGVGLPLATLFRASTIEALSALLTSEHAVEEARSLRLLSPSGDFPGSSSGNAAIAIHLIHDADGAPALYQALADCLGSAMRVYGIGPRSEGSFPVLHTRIAEMAGHHVEKIRRAQPRGPYRVGGLGAGGVLAHEVACRLQEAGERVDMVALFDSMDVAQRPSGASHKSGVFRRPEVGFAERLRAGTAKLSTALTRTGVDYTRVRLLRHYLDRGEQPPWFLEHIPLETVYRFAVSEFHPSRFDGRLTLFRATGSGAEDAEDTPYFELCRDPFLGWWQRASRGVELIEVAGGHRSMLLAPHVPSLARELLCAGGNTDAPAAAAG